MTDHAITNLRSIYITNQPYQYPLPWLKKKTTANEFLAGDFPSCINTGWHIIPNLLWGHLCTPRQWWEMMIKFEAISVVGVKTRIFNPIPIQTALSFQGTNTFPAFNNTVYAMTYTDNLYETPWFPWHSNVHVGTQQINMFYEWNPAFKEGLIPKKKTDKFPRANDCADTRQKLYDREDIYPAFYPTELTTTAPSSYQSNDLRRQQLPIYWYHLPYPQYEKAVAVTAGWSGLPTRFEEAFFDPSGIFWDPLTRPDHLGELRPGKNMVEFSWNAHPSDEGIWFNTDRLALLPPYPRPRPLQPPHGNMNRIDAPRVIDPIGPGKPIDRYGHLLNMGLIKSGETRTTAEEVMAPECATGLPNWRDFPIVPMRWFLEEIRESNPWAYENMFKLYYRENTVQNCPVPPLQSGHQGMRKGDVKIIGPIENTKFVGTEYEMYKYPPTQWFIKGIPLYDNQEKHIPVEMQAFMLTTVYVKGKTRSSGIYAPTWGPINPQDLYSINMDTSFGENFIRGRSGGARRTWYDPEDTRAVTNVRSDDIMLFPNDEGSQGIDVFPYPAGHQCIVEPKTGEVYEPRWPRIHAYQKQDLNIRVDVKTMSREVSAGKCGKRIAGNTMCMSD